VRREDDLYTVDVQSPLDSIPENSPEELKKMAKDLTVRIIDLLNAI
jgi:hypothetical protein